MFAPGDVWEVAKALVETVIESSERHTCSCCREWAPHGGGPGAIEHHHTCPFLVACDLLARVEEFRCDSEADNWGWEDS